MRLSSGLPAWNGVSFVPPFWKLVNFVMSSLPLGFLAPWQPKQFSLRMGATSLMKLTGPPTPPSPTRGGREGRGAESAAPAGRGATRNSIRARAAPSVAHRAQKQ